MNAPHVAKKGLEPIFLGYEPNELPITLLCQVLFFEKIKLDYKNTLKIRYLLFTLNSKQLNFHNETFWIYQKIKTPKKVKKNITTNIIKSKTPDQIAF